ncbi:GNAT family N-acetyltransferase [Roseomonas sp. 18066]|uniref:GNAT family N-acetyltransferase n=1 Tax=Roseomonas sp. 18066 TaxID=2681412 RepID=UPI00135945F1|nr:GNAT family N-acetyltransferase [Roseomonas sp. 18066]
MTFIRPADPADLPAITAIYGHHVATGRASFEIAPPPLADMQRRHAALVAAGMPYLVAEVDGVVLGYAYAGAYRPRIAYRDTVENSIYVAADAAGKGLGRLLLAALIEACTALGLRQMIAVVGDSANIASVKLHEAAGFRQVGVLRAVGRKHGEWLDSVLLQLPLGEGDTTPPGAEPG